MSLQKKRDRGCKNPNCKCSTGIHEGLTFGSGELDECGYWEKPCAECARAWEKIHPEHGLSWPFSDEEKSGKDMSDKRNVNGKPNIH